MHTNITERTVSTNPITNPKVRPLRQRMVEDMCLRSFVEKTRTDYLRCVEQLAVFLGCSPDNASNEDLRKYHLHMAKNGSSPTKINATMSALRFLFVTVLGRDDAVKVLPFVSQPRKLPVILSPEEVVRFLEAAPNLKYKAALSIAYGAGLRASEVLSLKPTDIDSTRMLIRVEQGKGRKDRYVMLSPHLLILLRDYWKAYKPNNGLNGGWLFPGRVLGSPLTTRQLNRACHAAAHMAEINKRVSLHTLRHSFATHLLEQDIDIRVIQVLLGHAKLDTTALYTQVATRTIGSVMSPLDRITTSGRLDRISTG